MSQTLADMAEAYVANAEVLAERIRKLKRALSKAKRERKAATVTILSQELDTLQSQHDEAVATANHLKTYYDKEARS